ncbi:MAG: SDR family oxidoreductase [Candidatus Thorarchaeota archaeon]
MAGKTCIVTGANSGIGRETALGLAKEGAKLIMLARSKQKGDEARKYIISASNTQVDLMLCDLSSMTEVRRFAREFSTNYDRLDVLINNAGAVFSKRDVTPEGFEMTFAVNYLAPFLLTHELLPILKSSAPSRIINLTSGLHSRARIDLDDLQSKRKYKGMDAYQTSKLMDLLFTYKLARELQGTGVSVNVVSPGFVATNLGSSSGSRMSKIMFGMMKPFQLSPAEGAETSIYVATSSELEGVTGRHFAKCQDKDTSDESYDTDLQDELWNRTIEILGL